MLLFIIVIILNSIQYSKNDEFIVNNNIDIGLAVDSDAGLKMPVLKNIETMDMNKLSSSLNNLIDSARLNSLTPDDLKGGIISISNLGSFNIRSFDKFSKTVCPHYLKRALP